MILVWFGTIWWILAHQVFYAALPPSTQKPRFFKLYLSECAENLRIGSTRGMNMWAKSGGHPATLEASAGPESSFEEKFSSLEESFPVLTWGRLVCLVLVGFHRMPRFLRSCKKKLGSKIKKLYGIIFLWYHKYICIPIFSSRRPETSISGENPCFPISGGHVHPPTTKLKYRKNRKIENLFFF